MPAAVDTNVLLPVIRGDVEVTNILVPFLDRYIQSLGLTISAPVYAELAAAPGMRVEALDQFLAVGQVAVEWNLSRNVWLRAAEAYRTYADRRQASGGGWPRRILADFIIGAHAERHADVLLTYNSDDFGRMFPDPEVIVPPVPGDTSTP